MVECLRHFLGLHQQIGAMEQKVVQVVCAESAQAAFYTVDDVLLGKIIDCGALTADAAFALQNQFVANTG